jgi:metal-responsive CopG/Arc/MetJ family transcriptional regulator
MKTAISIPDKLFREAETAARKKKMSRSQLYSTALAEYLKEQAMGAQVAKINEICDRMGSPLDPALERAQFDVLEREQW